MHLLQLFHKSASPRYGGVVPLIILLIASSVDFANSAAGRSANTVTINKCCRINESLDALRTCVVGGGDKWAPPVYLLKTKKLYNKTGELPPNMLIKEAEFPRTCHDPEFYYASNKIVLMGNGSLFLSTRDVMIPPEDYCVDKNAAIVCIERPINDMDLLTAPQILSTVKKCCGVRAAYSQDNGTCINLNKSHELYHSNVIKSPQVEVITGFPDCQKDDFALAGRFRLENFNDTSGEVRLEDGKIFHSSQFCLEHVIDGLDSSISIFTCSEHVQPASVPVHIHHQDIKFVFYSIGLLISVIFLCATLACGYLVPSNHHVLHWRCQTHYVACLLVGDLLLAITQISGNSIVGPTCSIIGK